MLLVQRQPQKVFSEKILEPNLKVLSSEIDLVESGINIKAFIKGSGAEIFSKISLSPIL
jgi:hypothetical protein